jgi:hypothetical protein
LKLKHAIRAHVGMQTEYSHRLSRRDCVYSAFRLLHVRASRWKTCYSTTSTAAAAAAGKRHRVASTPRWFGSDTESCGADVFQDEVVAVAAYDLDSGDAYTAMINPALHNPSMGQRNSVVSQQCWSNSQYASIEAMLKNFRVWVWL